MTVVLDLRMSTNLVSITLEPAWWRFSPAGQRGIQNGSSTVAGNLLEDRFSARTARTFVAQILAVVVATFERSATHPSAYMFRFDTVIDRTRSGT